MTTLDKRSIEIRKKIVQILDSSRRGHIGSSLSLIEIIRVLYDDILKFDSKKPRWSDRDRFILSKGHGCLALYAILAEKGFFPESELLKFCKADGILGGHPEYGKVPGVEASTGSLGHGLSIGIGFALYAKMVKANHRVFVLISDGELNEGSTWEALLSAGKHRLSNLTILVDYNRQQSYGAASSVQDLEPLVDKLVSFGFSVKEADGHNVTELKTVLSKIPFSNEKPSILICRTVKGKGISFAENNPAWHHKPKITDDEIKSLYAALESKL